MVSVAVVHACVFLLEFLQIDPAQQATDDQPPEAPVVRGASVAPNPVGGSCADIDVLRVVVDSETDARSPADEVGYRLELVAGRLPYGFALPAQPLRATSGEVRYAWLRGDGTSALTLRVSAVDRAGNVSAPVLVDVDVDDGAGCAVARGRGGSATAALLVVAAALLLRRRRSSSCFG